MTRKLEKILIWFGAAGVLAATTLTLLPSTRESSPEYIIGLGLFWVISSFIGTRIYDRNESKESQERLQKRFREIEQERVMAEEEYRTWQEDNNRRRTEFEQVILPQIVLGTYKGSNEPNPEQRYLH